MRNTLLVLSASIGLGLGLVSSARASDKGIALVEFYSSEGCSSCPPADVVASKIISDSEKSGAAIYVVAFHVDYWNYLGWADPFSQAIFSQRQREFAHRMNLPSIYTPQMIVNGHDEFVGSDAKHADASINKALDTDSSAHLTLRINPQDRAYTIDVTSDKNPKDSVLNIALAESGLSSDVTHGENANHKLTHDNVVRVFRTTTLDRSATATVEMTLPDGVNPQNSKVIAWLEDGKTGAVLAANAIKLHVGKVDGK